MRNRLTSAAPAPIAVLDARPGPVSGAEHFDTYDFEVINTGRAAARNVQAWIANEMDEVVSATVDLHVIPVDNRWYTIRIEVRRVISRAGGLHLVLKWTDDAGEHRAHALDVAVVLPPVPN
jgi:hypothetical protein